MLLALAFPALAEARQAAKPDQPGVFDYYVLTLSWSPQYCATKKLPADDPQCGAGKHFSFVVHGLWPQYASGYPQSCSTESLAQGLADSYLDIMPSRQLIQHEWEKHGTCSGLDSQHYFEDIRNVFNSITVPQQYHHPAKPLTRTLKQFKQDLLNANPGLDASAFSVACTGKYLNEVEVCFDKALKPRACEHDVHDACPASRITIRAVR